MLHAAATAQERPLRVDTRFDLRPSRMKGILFTEFLDMVDERFSPLVLDQILLAARLPSEGAYTAVGTYDHGEIWRLVCELSKVTEIAVPELLRAYGEYLFPRLAAAHPHVLEGMRSCFDVLQALDGLIHREVGKLYPDAELPRFQVTERSADRLTVLYESKRPFADLAEGLMRGCGQHFGQNVIIARQNLPADGAVRVRFTLMLS
jgi:hypothetical protein